MLSRLLASPLAIFFYVSQTLTMTLVIMTQYLSKLFNDPLKIIPKKMYEDTETIGILLIATGVLLECRETIIKRVLREKQQEDSNFHLSKRDSDLEYFGVVLLILGLTMELIVAITNYLNEHGKSNSFFQSVEVNFNLFTMFNLTLLMGAGTFAMLRVIFMFLPRRKSSVAIDPPEIAKAKAHPTEEKPKSKAPAKIAKKKAPPNKRKA